MKKLFLFLSTACLMQFIAACKDSPKTGGATASDPQQPVTEIEEEGLMPYTVLSDSNTVLTFYYDNQRAERGGMIVKPFTIDLCEEETIDENNQLQRQWCDTDRGWHNNISDIRSVVFDKSFADCPTISSTAYWFYGCSNLTDITGMSNLNTSNVTDMDYMFGGCSSLKDLDLSNFDTGSVESMRCMFLYCSGLTDLDLSHFDTGSLVYMCSMFNCCSNLATLDLSHFDTSNVTNMLLTFNNCSHLSYLDLSNFDTRKVDNMYGMFRLCSSLTILDLSHFDTENVENMSSMFEGCNHLRTIYVGSGWSTASVMDRRSMFYNCTGSLTEKD